MKVKIHFLSINYELNVKSEFDTQGILLQNGKYNQLKFFEPEGIKVVVNFNDEIVKISRDERSKIEFINNKETLYIINGPYGIVNINIYTTNLEITNNLIHVEYYFNNDLNQLSHLEISFTKE